MNRRRLSVLAALVSSGCLSVPPFGDGVGFRPDDHGGTIIGKDFSLHFGGGTFAFPDRLEIAGANLLETRSTCSDEDGAGIAIAPGFVASPSSTSTGGSSLSTILNGPAAVQIQVEWSGSFTCNTADTAMGTSIFTAFPDGRIVRNDQITVDVPSSDTPTCGCAQDSNFFVTSFFNFSTSAFDGVGSMNATLPAPTGIGPYFGMSMCLEHQDGPRVVLAYDVSQARLHGIDNGSFAVDFDLIDISPTLSSVSMQNTMAIRANTGELGCAELTHALGDIDVNFDLDMGQSDLNGIFKAPAAAQNGSIMITAGDNTVPGIAVTVKFPGATDISVPVPSFHQHNDDDSFTIWFRDPFSTVIVTGT